MVAGTFWSKVSHGDKMLQDTEFLIIEGQGKPLLCRDTSIKLGLLKIGPSFVNSLDNQSMTKDQIINKYPKCFEGFGKLKDFQLDNPIHPNVEPVIQNVRWIPFNLRESLVISWMNLKNWILLKEYLFRQLLLCQSLEGTYVYVQIYAKGLYRYKRLNFGISCAVEMFQKVIQQILQGCEVVQNILDDIIVHAPNQQEHDKRLEKVLNVLQEKGITLNREKYRFNMPKLEFMGKVSECGVGPSEAKVSAVMNAREPTSISEVHSWLVLAQYDTRFIPDLGTISEQLRKLKHKNAIFKWCQAEQDSFDQLKKCLVNAKTLGSYDTNAETQVIADASPVGLGAVLTLKQGEDYTVICYASRSLTDTEKRYSQTEKEVLVWACEKFHAWIYGSEFKLLTDHVYSRINSKSGT